MEPFEQGCLERFHEVDLRITEIRREIADLRAHCDDIHAWRLEDTAKSAWYYEVRPVLEELVDSTRWLKTTRRVIVWSFGAIAGTIMAYQTLVIWVKENMK